MTEDFRNNSIEQEIADARDSQESREGSLDGFTIPDKFREKSAEEIIQSYQELEKAYGRQAQTVGQLRKSVDQLLEFNTPSKSEPVEPPKPLSADDFYENPDDAVRRVVREETTGKLDKVTQELDRTRRELTLKDFESRHPDWKDKAQSPEFVNWVNERPYRARLAAQADQYDFDAAEELFSMYEDSSRGRKEHQDRQHRSEQLERAGLESGAASQPPMTKTFSRFDLLNKRIRAKQGDRKAAMWLSENGQAIQRAYEEGRIVD